MTYRAAPLFTAVTLAQPQDSSMTGVKGLENQSVHLLIEVAEKAEVWGKGTIFAV